MPLTSQGSSQVACRPSDTASRAEALRPLHSRLLFLCGLERAKLAPNHTGTHQWLRRRRKATDFWRALVTGISCLEREQKAICNSFLFHCSSIHLKAFQHGSSATYKDFLFKKSFGNRDVTYQIS